MGSLSWVSRLIGRHGRARDALVALACGLVVGLLIVQARDRREGQVNAEWEMTSGARYADSLERSVAPAPVEAIRTGDAVAALYLERLRMGLGSPFRIIDESQRDPLLPDSLRMRVGHALLARTLAGEAYRIDPAALSLIAFITATDEDVGRAHLAIIDSVVRSHDDPRVGELTVRLAYRLAFAAGDVSRRAPEIAIQAAAQSRDRVLAIRDARLLIRAALAAGSDPLALLTTWRAERRFGVERPVLLQLTGRAEAAATAALPATVARISEVARRGPEATPARRRLTPRPDGLARRMAGLAELRAAPPQAPIAVTLSGYSGVIEAGSTTRVQREVVRRFVGRARNEEALAGEFALLRARIGGATPEAAMAVLTAGVALRPYAQERAWLPGESGPTVAEVQSRHGFASIEFDANIPARWRPYYRRVLDDAVLDMRRVFPSIDLTGLKVRFGESPLGDRALAMHDPVSRTVYFPSGSGAGVMAHEFAHDLDWQAARRRYGASIGYRTDRAVRQSSDWLAGAVRRMASAPRSPPDRAATDVTSERPTEVFARNVDWFVSAALARDARMNGYLSAVQDPVLTGYASASTPEAARDGGEATLRALDGISPPSPRARRWFDNQFGGGRQVSVHESVRRVLEVPVESGELRRHDAASFNGVEAARAVLRNVPATSAAWSCWLDVLSGHSANRQSTSAVAQYAAESRARGIVKRWAELSRRYGSSAPWRMRALEGGPWSPGTGVDVTREIRDAILWRALRDPVSDFPAASLRNSRGSCNR